MEAAMPRSLPVTTGRPCSFGRRDCSQDAKNASPSMCTIARGNVGRVDELFDDNPHGNEMNQSQKGLAQFLIPRGNASKLLEVVEETFNLLTELVEVFIIV